ncbi:hypothetical protein CN918_25760 [Priestia megaterium]|nr:hypothetical protein CN918_25760 [Priestia megaterium]
MKTELGKITEWLEPHLTLYGVIALWVIAYFMFSEGLSLLTRKQKEKKKRVMEKIKYIKEPYREKDEILKDEEVIKDKVRAFFQKTETMPVNQEKAKHFVEGFATIVSKNRWMEALRFEKHLTDEELETVRAQSHQAIKEEKSRAGLPLLNFIIRIVTFIVLLHYFYTVKQIDSSELLILLTTIVSFFATVTRKTAFLFFILALLSYWVYHHVSGAALYFFLFYWLVKGIHFRTKNLLKSKKEE